MLEGLDDVDWAALTHAYGPATDVPGWLREMGGSEPEAAHSAFVSAVFHQGTVDDAAVAAVPFLVSLALEAPYDRMGVLLTLGTLADPRHALGPLVPSARAALSREASRLLPLIDDPDAEIREAVVYTLAQASMFAVLRPLLSTETDPDVRSALLLALASSDPSVVDISVRAQLRDEEPAVVLAAATALARSGLRWTDSDVDAFVDRFDPDAVGRLWWLAHGYGLANVILPLPVATALLLLRRLIARDISEIRAAVVDALEQWYDVHDAPDELLVLVEPFLSDRDRRLRRDAANILTGLGLTREDYDRWLRSRP